MGVDETIKHFQGLTTKQNLLGFERILLSVTINMVTFSAMHGDLTGQVFSMFILTVAAAEAAIGLAILVVFFRNRSSIAVEDISTLKG